MLEILRSLVAKKSVLLNIHYGHKVPALYKIVFRTCVAGLVQRSFSILESLG